MGCDANTVAHGSVYAWPLLPLIMRPVAAILQDQKLGAAGSARPHYSCESPNCCPLPDHSASPCVTYSDPSTHKQTAHRYLTTHFAFTLADRRHKHATCSSPMCCMCVPAGVTAADSDAAHLGSAHSTTLSLVSRATTARRGVDDD